jgi:tetratricopeptide (TPR) repeat protein
VITAVFLVLAALGALSYRQAGFWRNSETLWTHAVAVTKGNYIAHLNLGDTLLDEGRPDDAAPQFHAAARIRPDDPTVQLNVATFERRVGNFEPALEGDQAILRLTSDRALRALTFNNLGLDYRCLRDYVHARESYAAALSLQPDSARAFIGLGVIAQRTGDIAEAVRNFSRAVEVEPTDLEYLLLAQALEQTGEHAAAQAALEESRKRSSNFDLTQRAVFSVLSR